MMATAQKFAACRYCTFTANRKTELWRHYQLSHCHSKHGVPCLVDGRCPHRFKSFASFKSHVSRIHVADYQPCLNINCNMCMKSVQGIEAFFSHLRQHVSLHEFVDCPFDGCMFRSNVSTTFRSHISRVHSCKDVKLLKATHISTAGSSSGSNSQMVGSDNDSAIPLETDEIEDGMVLPTESVNMVYDEEKIVHLIAGLCLRMQVIFNVPISAVDEVLSALNRISYFSTLNLCQKLKVALQNVGISENSLLSPIEELVKDENIFSKCTSNSSDYFCGVGVLGTHKRRMSYYKSRFPYVPPTEYKLGYKFGKNHSYMYISILSSLQKLLSRCEILQEIVNPVTQLDSFYRSYDDGLFCKQNELFNEHEICLKIGLYFDDWESINPLGTARKKHKISAFYWVLLNLRPEHRSSLNLIQVCLLAKSEDVRYFGLDVILQPLLTEIKILETDGVYIESLGENILGTLAYVSADNLAAHQLGGFSESFGPHVTHFCRFCDAKYADISDTAKDVSSFTMRTKCMYNEQAKAASDAHASDTGVKCVSALHGDLKYFHVVTGLLPDVAHDLLEGVVPVELCLCIRYLISKGYFSLTFINHQIRTFRFSGHDQISKPQVINIGNDSKTIGGNAHENWCLLRMLPLLVGAHIPEGEPSWVIILYLKDIVEIAFSPVLSESAVAYLDMLIKEHKLLLKQTFPNFSLKPKHHFLEHYPQLIKCFGPLAFASTLRFEAKHGLLKKCMRQNMNYRNICKSLAKKHQLHQALLLSEGDLLKPTCVSTRDCNSLGLDVVSERMQHALQDFCDASNSFRHYTCITINGTKYELQMAVAVEVVDGLVMFGIIKLIVLDTEGECCFVCNMCDTVYSQHLHCYELLQTDVIRVVKHSHLVDYYPLAVYEVHDSSVVSMKHFAAFL